MAELSFYVSLLCTIFTDVKRKDFLEQVIHHFATVSLIAFSYVCGYTRIGTLVMWCHDVSDIFLEGAKLCVYSKKNSLADLLFVGFGVVFFIRFLLSQFFWKINFEFLSRLVYYPFWIVHTSWVKSMWIFSPFPGYYLFNFLLMVLQVLHIFWFYLIVKMAFRLMSGNQVEDSRSDSEESDPEEDSKDK